MKRFSKFHPAIKQYTAVMGNSFFDRPTFFSNLITLLKGTYQLFLSIPPVLKNGESVDRNLIMKVYGYFRMVKHG